MDQRLYLLLLFSHISFASIVQVGAGNYTTTLPSGAAVPQLSSGAHATPAISATFNQPITTNKWWTSLLWKFASNTSQNLFPYPLSALAQTNGLTLSYVPNASVTPNTTVNGYQSQEYHYNPGSDLTLSVQGLASSEPVVSGYSDCTVTAWWQDASHTLSITLGHGLPFAYCFVSGGSAQITCTGTPTIWYNQNGTLGLTINGNNYGIFGPSGSSWSGTTTLLSTLNGKDYFSVAILPDNTPATLLTYQKHAFAFVTNSTVSWNYNPATSQLTTTFNFTTQLQETNQNWINQPLLALFRHQWLNCPQSLTTYTYQSPRGLMKVLAGSSFNTVLTFNGILPGLPVLAQEGLDGYSSTQLYDYVNTIYQQTPASRWEGAATQVDYWVGKAVGRMAQLILIADQINFTAARDLFLTELEGYLQDWFTASDNKNLFYYIPSWNTLIGDPASYGSDTQMNDHHFHYGYFIHAAAVVAKYDPSWASPSNWGGMVEMLIKDVANWDRTDNRFPYFRNFDFYEGHSWASGAAMFGAGENQESSSEAMNFAIGTFLWGYFTNNTTIRDLGVYLYTTEAQSILQYWFDVDQQVFPAAYTKPNVGMVWGNGGAYATWFGGPSEAVHGINFLPITAGSVYLGYNPTYLATNLAFMLSNGGQTSYWPDIIMETTALTSPSQAITQFNSNPNYSVEYGETQAHTYSWINTLNAIGQLDTLITANIPSYAVFKSPTTNAKTYIAYNNQNTTTTVTFSDGTTLSIPANSFGHTNGTVISPTGPSNPTGGSGQCATNYCYTITSQSNGTLLVEFVPKAASNFVVLHYLVNNTNQQNVNMQQNGDTWSWIIPAQAVGSTITFSFTYTIGTPAYNSPWYTYTVGSPVSPTGPHGGQCATNYCYTITAESNDTLLVNFVPHASSDFVVLHYLVNGANQQNVTMQATGNIWSWTIPKQSSGTTITLSFTYTIGNPAYNSPWYTYIVP